jgi:hypothetical protein
MQCYILYVRLIVIDFMSCQFRRRNYYVDDNIKSVRLMKRIRTSYQYCLFRPFSFGVFHENVDIAVLCNWIVIFEDSHAMLLTKGIQNIDKITLGWADASESVYIIMGCLTT